MGKRRVELALKRKYPLQQVAITSSTEKQATTRLHMVMTFSMIGYICLLKASILCFCLLWQHSFVADAVSICSVIVTTKLIQTAMGRKYIMTKPRASRIKLLYNYRADVRAIFLHEHKRHFISFMTVCQGGNFVHMLLISVVSQ